MAITDIFKTGTVADQMSAYKKSTTNIPTGTNLFANNPYKGSANIAPATSNELAFNYTPISSNQVVNSPVDVSKLNQTSVYDVGNTNNQTSFNTFTATGNKIVEGATTKPVEEKPSRREETLTALTDLIKRQGEQGERTLDLQDQYDLEQKQKRLNQLNTRALEIDRAYEKQIREMRRTNPSGQLMGGIENDIQNLSRQRNEELADIGIQQAIAQGNVDLANDIIKTKIDAEFEPIKNQIDSLKTFYSLYSDDLTSSEKILLENQIKIQVDEYKNGVASQEVEEQSKAYADAVKSGSLTLKDVPDKYQAATQNKLSQIGFVDPLEKTKMDKAQSTLSLANEIMGFDLGLEVGAGWQRALQNVSSFIGSGGDSEARKAKINQLKALLTFDNLSQLKGLGAMSDREFATITASAAALNEKMSEKTFKEELGKIVGIITDKMIASPATDRATKEDLLIQKLMTENPNLSPEKIGEMAEEILGQSFNSVGNTTASTGNRPQRNNNAGNLKAGGVADNLAIGTDEQGHLIFPDAQTGLKALQMDLEAKISGRSRYLSANPTLAQLGSVYAEDSNWANGVARILGIPTSTKTQSISLSALTKAIAQQEGFYA